MNPQQREYLVLAHPEGPNFAEIQRSVEAANALQRYFRCKLMADPRLLSAEEEEVNAKALAVSIRRAYPRQRVIAATESYYDTRLVLEERLPDVILATCAEWDTDSGDKDAPSLQTFLLHTLASSLITFEAGLTPETNQKMGHKKSVGCLFDWWENSEQLEVILVCARMCAQCEQRLQRRFNVAPAAIQATRQILNHVRRRVLGEHPQIPTKVFVAHGWSRDWQELKAILDELGVEVAEFNQTVPIGGTVTERWKEMLDQSRFAFALLTPDEEVAPGVPYPRPNVIHEIGLCQGRFGLESTVVMREKSIRPFSNLSGVIDLEFESGRISAQRPVIEKLLERHGLLDRCPP
jgi:predicted nucleotide-binding protein